MTFVAGEVQRSKLIFGCHSISPFFDLFSRHLENFLSCFYQKANFSVLTLQYGVMQKIEIFVILHRFNRYTRAVEFNEILEQSIVRALLQLIQQQWPIDFDRNLLRLAHNPSMF